MDREGEKGRKRGRERERERERDRETKYGGSMLCVNKFLANSPNVWKISPTHPFVVESRLLAHPPPPNAFRCYPSPLSPFKDRFN